MRKGTEIEQTNLHRFTDTESCATIRFYSRVETLQILYYWDLVYKTLTFPYLKGQPSIRIFKDEGSMAEQDGTYNVNVLEDVKVLFDLKDEDLPIEVTWEEIDKKV